MEKIDLNAYLAGNAYPARGLAIAQAPHGRQTFIAYSLVARSATTRNRALDPPPSRRCICPMSAHPPNPLPPAPYL